MTVIRDGRKVGTITKEQLEVDELVRMMVGKNLKTLYPKEQVRIGETVLRIENLSRAGEFNNVSFELKRGEILGMVGLVGAGRTEVARTIFGVQTPEGGKIFLNGKEVRIGNPRRAMELGIAYLSESRGEYGMRQVAHHRQLQTGLQFPQAVDDRCALRQVAIAVAGHGQQQMRYTVQRAVSGSSRSIR